LRNTPHQSAQTETGFSLLEGEAPTAATGTESAVSAGAAFVLASFGLLASSSRVDLGEDCSPSRCVVLA
jgi:hypothetical protein